MQIGPYTLSSPVILAPMVGVTDKPFRLLCRQLGAGLAVSEMTSANPLLRGSRKSQQRLDFSNEPGPVGVQIAGHDPQQLADAARYCMDQGAQIIDINMGCPAKKVCNVAAGSALLRDELLVGRILDAVVRAVPVPVTLKIRTGYTRGQRNALSVARVAESAGIAAIAVHGRTREDLFRGEAEYDSVATVKAAIGIPVIANGDIDTPEKAQLVLTQTGCDAVMIGRAAQGRPWIFREIAHYLATGTVLPAPSLIEVRDHLLGHLEALHTFYGEHMGVRIARKHLGWYSRAHPGHLAFRNQVNQTETAEAQIRATQEHFRMLIDGARLAA
ncbi:MAG: tRNA dihydrouridine synthase DusB [Chromatiales bacterium]|nr:tRNA dihydrouridine synthase DusB [Chromatiales bacterium]